MIKIGCSSCAVVGYLVLPSGEFECLGCGHTIAACDFDLDEGTTWAVNEEGLLGWVYRPERSILAMHQAIDEYAEAEQTPHAELAALRAFREAADELHTALGAGLTYPDGRSLRAYVQRETYDQAQAEAAAELAELLSDGYWLMDISNSSAGMGCTEAETVCEFLSAFGHERLAADVLREHAEHDDEGDSHGLDENGELITRS